MGKTVRLGDVPDGGMMEVDDILLVRQGDHVHGLAAKCPHAGGPLAEGALCGEHLVCPWHKAVFRVSDGALVEPPALDPLDRYAVEVTPEGEITLPAQPLPRPIQLPDPESRTFLIVGAGAAGTAAAASLREFGFGGRVVLADAEDGWPFDRTSLSKFVMEGGMPPGEAPTLRPPGWFAAHRIDRVAARVTLLDVAARRARFADGHDIGFDAALVAPGGEPKRLPLPGADQHGVYTLRSRADAARILAAVPVRGRAVILGGSFIGLEVASGLRKQGIEVAVVSPESVPLANQLGPEIGASLQRLHAAHGVAFHFGTQATRIDGAPGALTVTLQSGARLSADVVVTGVGVQPATQFIAGLALRDDGSIAVDASMRAAEAVWAAGDVAAFPYRGETVRVEHWRVAQQQARVAARAMLGGAAAFDGVPFFWTYHYGRRFEYLGHATTWDEVRIDGALDEQRFVAFLAQAGVVRAVVACQRESETATLHEAMRRELPLGAALRLLRDGR